MAKLDQKYEEIVQNNLFARHNHVEIDEVSEDHVYGHIDLVPETLNVYGMVHGGAYFVLADTCAGFMARVGGGKHVTRSATSEFLHSVREGRITAHAYVLERSRKFCLVEVKIYDDRKRAVFIGTYNYYCMDGLSEERDPS